MVTQSSAKRKLYKEVAKKDKKWEGATTEPWSMPEVRWQKIGSELLRKQLFRPSVRRAQIQVKTFEERSSLGSLVVRWEWETV